METVKNTDIDDEGVDKDVRPELGSLTLERIELFARLQEAIRSTKEEAQRQADELEALLDELAQAQSNITAAEQDNRLTHQQLQELARIEKTLRAIQDQANSMRSQDVEQRRVIKAMIVNIEEVIRVTEGE